MNATTYRLVRRFVADLAAWVSGPERWNWRLRLPEQPASGLKESAVVSKIVFEWSLDRPLPLAIELTGRVVCKNRLFRLAFFQNAENCCRKKPLSISERGISQESLLIRFLATSCGSGSLGDDGADYSGVGMASLLVNRRGIVVTG